MWHDNVEIFFRTEIGGKAAFVHDVVGQAQTHFLGNDTARAVGDIAEGSGVNQGGRAVGGLDQIGENGFCEQRHHSSGRAEVASADRFSVTGNSDDDAIEPPAKILEIFRKGDDGHDFRSGGDDEAGLAAAALFLAVERNGDAAQGAVVHVDGTRPGDALGIKMQIVAVEEMRIDKSGEQIVRRGDGVKIAVEMEIDFRTRLDLRKAAPGGGALHAEHRAERRLARGDDHASRCGRDPG